MRRSDSRLVMHLNWHKINDCNIQSHFYLSYIQKQRMKCLHLALSQETVEVLSPYMRALPLNQILTDAVVYIVCCGARKCVLTKLKR